MKIIPLYIVVQKKFLEKSTGNDLDDKKEYLPKHTIVSLVKQVIPHFLNICISDNLSLKYRGMVTEACTSMWKDFACLEKKNIVKKTLQFFG